MCPSTDAATAEARFASNVLEDLLGHIATENAKNANGARAGHHVFNVSHAWTEGPVMYLVYRTPPLDMTWGLVRDTRRSLINPGPWNDTDNPALYYYLLDLEEEWPGGASGEPGNDPNIIRWSGWPCARVPERLAEIPDSNRRAPKPVENSEIGHMPSPTTEPRRYANPL
jgi:hypothetical protein